MARTKLTNKIRGLKRMVAHMSVVPKAKTEYVNKYIYSLWELSDGRVVKRRRLNPLFSAD